MTEVLSLLAGMALGVLVCALMVALIALIWRDQWRRALVYFGLADARDEAAAADAPAEPEFVVRGKPLGSTRSFEWPRARGRPVRH